MKKRKQTCFLLKLVYLTPHVTIELKNRGTEVILQCVMRFYIKVTRFGL